MSRSSRRGPWLPEEDAALLHLVRTQGPNNWVRISQHMQHRSPKQCRERFHQNLKPSLNHEPISAEEGEMIEQLVQEMGKRWAEIARRLGNRSDNAVKNWWNGSMNRRKRTDLQQSGGSRMVEYRTLPIPTSAPAHQSYAHELPMPLHQTIRYPSPAPLSFHRPDAPHASYSFTDTRSFAPEHNHNGKPRTEPNTTLGQMQFQSSSYSSFEHARNNTSQSRPSRLSPCPPVESVLPLRPFLATRRSTDRAEWQLPPFCAIEAPTHSPALTESSHASLNQRAPSLVSDDQSNCSISPKTVPSPHSGMSTSKEPTMHVWPEMLSNNTTSALQNERPVRLDHTAESNDRTTPYLTATEQRPSNLPSRPNLSHSYSLPRVLASSPRSASLENSRPGRASRETATDTAKDTRMNVSSLLG